HLAYLHSLATRRSSNRSATASRLYGFDTKSSGAYFSRMSVDASGVSAIDSTRGVSPGGGARFDRGLLFGVVGGVLDPETLSMRGDWKSARLRSSHLMS